MQSRQRRQCRRDYVIIIRWMAQHHRGFNILLKPFNNLPSRIFWRAIIEFAQGTHTHSLTPVSGFVSADVIFTKITIALNSHRFQFTFRNESKIRRIALMHRTRIEHGKPAPVGKFQFHKCRQRRQFYYDKFRNEMK